MSRKRLFIIGLITILTVNQGYSQITYSMKAETGFLQYKTNMIQVDPGPNWKGYYLDGENGFDFNIVTGVDFKSKLFAGIGIGSLGFKGINGLSVFSDFEYLPLKTRMTPLINLKIGRSHIWNQYENGTGTLLGEFGLGLNFRMTKKLDIYTRSGFLMTQQSSLVPVRMGLRFSFIDE